MLKETARYLAEEPTSLEEVIFCLWSDEDLEIFKAQLEQLTA
jgi:hypothetical protein